MKTCVTCKHFKQEKFAFVFPLDIRYAKCISPNNGTNAVTGTPQSVYADHARSMGRCGREGRDWEAK